MNCSKLTGLLVCLTVWLLSSVHMATADVIVQRCIAWPHRQQQPVTDCPRAPTTALTSFFSCHVPSCLAVVCRLPWFLVASSHHARGSTDILPTDIPADNENSSHFQVATNSRPSFPPRMTCSSCYYRTSRSKTQLEWFKGGFIANFGHVLNLVFST